jgi:DNA polymerase III subunit epsilon
MRFVAIDVETANEDYSSICQIGLASFVDGKLASEWKTYVDPEGEFSAINVSIHGINEQTVRGAPTFEAITARLQEQLDGAIAVHHTFFDRAAIVSAAAKYGVRPPGCKWLDSARVARRIWPEVRRSGFGLGPLCEKIRYEYRAHDALEDAKAAGQVLLEAIRTSGTGLDEWLMLAYSPVGGGSRAVREGDPSGPLWGEVVVFTGALSLPRAEAAEIAARLGCRVGQGVTKETTILVIGDQDAARLNGHDKSSKQRKAEQLAAAGQPIRFLSETQFSDLSRILDDGAISRNERDYARAVIRAASPGAVPLGLGVVEPYVSDEPSVPLGSGSTAALRLVVPDDGDTLERKLPLDLASVQFLRGASGSKQRDVQRALATFAALLQQDLESATSSLDELGDQPSPGAVLDELEQQVAAFGAVSATVTGFLERSCLDESQRFKVRALSSELVRTRLGSLRKFLSGIGEDVPAHRKRIAALILSADLALASM